MIWQATSDLAAFRDAALPFLRADPVGNTVLLTIAETLWLSGADAFGSADPLLGWLVDDDGAVAGAFLHTPPYPLLMGPAPVAAAGALVERLGSHALTGVSGPPDLARAVAEGLAARRGARVAVRRRERLYRLGELVPPAVPPAGRAVQADGGRRELLVAWYGAFAEEIGEAHAASMGGMVDDRLSHGGLWLWEDASGVPVSLVAHSRVLADMARIGPVYTPPELRGRGYAGALTAAAAAGARTAGAREVLLFTDLANPTSNSIYQRVGFVPVDDRIVLELA